MPFVVATCTMDYATVTDLEPCAHRDEDVSIIIESEETAIQFAMEAVTMLTVLYDLAGEPYQIIPNGPLLNVCTARRVVAFGIKTF